VFNKTRLMFGIILLAISSFQWGYFEGKVYSASKLGLPIETQIIPIIFIAISALVYSLGIFFAPINLGLWVSLWEIGAFIAVVMGMSKGGWKNWNEGVFLGWVFITLGVLLLTLGWEVLYGEYGVE